VAYRVRKRSRLRRAAATAAILAVIAALVLGGIGFASAHFGSTPTGSTSVPTATYTPTPVPVIGFRAIVQGTSVDPTSGLWSQHCQSSAELLNSTTLFLDNTASNAPVSWQLSFTSDPGAKLTPDETWAAVTGSSSGETAAGSSTTLTIAPSQYLCKWLFNSADYNIIHLMVIVTYHPGNPDSQEPLVSTDQVSLQPTQ
jgi:hypothetical protein